MRFWISSIPTYSWYRYSLSLSQHEIMTIFKLSYEDYKKIIKEFERQKLIYQIKTEKNKTRYVFTQLVSRLCNIIYKELQELQQQSGQQLFSYEQIKDQQFFDFLDGKPNNTLIIDCYEQKQFDLVLDNNKLVGIKLLN